MLINNNTSFKFVTVISILSKWLLNKTITQNKILKRLLGWAYDLSNHKKLINCLINNINKRECSKTDKINNLQTKL